MPSCACFRNFSVSCTIADVEHAALADADDAILRAAGDRVPIQAEVDRPGDLNAGCIDVCNVIRQVIIAARQSSAVYIAFKRGIVDGCVAVMGTIRFAAYVVAVEVGHDLDILRDGFCIRRQDEGIVGIIGTVGSGDAYLYRQ